MEMMQDYAIRRLEENEYGILADFLYEAIYIPDGVEAPPKSIIEQPELQIYISDWGREHDYCLVAEVEGKIVGAIWVRIMDDYGHIDDETPSLAISLYKEYRGMGIGSSLMKEMLAYLKQAGYSGVSLSVQKANYACRMYLKLGFEIVMEREEELLMQKHLYTDKSIDGGKAFDWGRVSKEYGKYRDIYPAEFYDRVLKRGLCITGQRVLDLGTGTGVLPRNLYSYGAEWTGTDISENQIQEARRLSEAAGMDITYSVCATEDIDYPEETFDVITACQCFWYFHHEQVAPKLARILKRDGRLLVLYMAWLPFEDSVAGASEELVLKYNPKWSGAGETKKPIHIPDAVLRHFDIVSHEEFDLNLPFTRESWHGRMKACRGVGASLTEAELAAWEQEHKNLLNTITTEPFTVAHYGAITELMVKKREDTKKYEA